MRKYRLVAKKGEGTFSEVLKAQNVKDGKYHAIKCMKNRFDNIDQVLKWIDKTVISNCICICIHELNGLNAYDHDYFQGGSLDTYSKKRFVLTIGFFAIYSVFLFYDMILTENRYDRVCNSVNDHYILSCSVLLCSVYVKYQKIGNNFLYRKVLQNIVPKDSERLLERASSQYKLRVRVRKRKRERER